MNRRWIALSIFVLTLAPVGCASPGASRLQTQISPGKWFAWVRSDADAKSETPGDDNPFIAEGKANGVISDDPNTVTLAKHDATNSGNEYALDPEVQRMLQDELREATPEERQEWFRMLADVEPENAKKVIRLLSSQRANEKSSRSTESQYADKSSGANHIDDSTRQASFGTSPWGGSRNERRRQPASPVSLSGIDTNPIEENRIAQASLNRLKQSKLHAPNPDDSEYSRRGYEDRNDHPSQLPGEFKPQRSMMIAATTDSKNAAEEIRIQSASHSQTVGLSDWERGLQRLIAAAETEFAKTSPGATEEERLEYTAQQVYLRMLYMMNDQQVRSMEAIKDLDPEDQEFWQQMFWSMADYFDDDQMPNSEDRAAQAVAQLSTAIERLRQKAPLELQNVQFTRQINSFGDYELFDRNVFSPGQEVLVYAELKNQKSDALPNGIFRTSLKSRIEIYKVGAGPKSGLVDHVEFKVQDDYCRNRRIDFFNGYPLILPDDLPIGPFELKLIVEDQLSNKVAEYQIDFSIH